MNGIALCYIYSEKWAGAWVRNTADAPLNPRKSKNGHSAKILTREKFQLYIYGIGWAQRAQRSKRCGRPHLLNYYKQVRPLAARSVFSRDVYTYPSPLLGQFLGDFL